MDRLFNFVYFYRFAFTFLLLVLVCSWLIIKNNSYQSTLYFNSSNRVFAEIQRTSKNIRDYFSLTEVNAALAKENSFLRKTLEQNIAANSAHHAKAKDSVYFNQFNFTSAKVIDNSTHFFKNYITIDRGSDDHLKPGMGVISNGCVVGKVKSVSKHFSVLISLLNIDEQVSCVIKRTGHFATAQWDGINPAYILVKYVPRHVHPIVGDSVVTSGYNSVFPAGIFIGKIQEIILRNEALFYDIKGELGQDFGKLSYVEVIESRLKNESDSLKRATHGELK